MAAAMSTISVTAVSTAWVAVVADAAAGIHGIQNMSSLPVLVRVDASAATSDAVTAAEDILNPGEYRAYTLILHDVVVARMVDVTYTGALTLRKP